MSHEHEVMWRLQKEREERLRRERSGKYVEKALKNLSEQYTQFINSEYDAYVPSEMQMIKEAINQITRLSVTDPVQAQTLCYDINYTVNNMKFLVSAAKNEFARQERMRYENIKLQQEETKAKLITCFNAKISEIKDPKIINFCMKEINQIRENIEKGSVLSENEVDKSFLDLGNIADIKYAEWKTKKLEDEKVNLLKENISACIDDIEKEKFENKEKQQSILTELKVLLDTVSISTSEEEIAAKLSELRTKSDDALISEEARKDIVFAIVKELRSQEFVVDKPKIFGEGKDSYVVINAKKPSGKHAVCKINLEGKLNYRFDNYEGMTCLKDIEKFNYDLEKIYSVNFSDDRVLWENPDRLSRTQNMTSDQNRRNS